MGSVRGLGPYSLRSRKISGSRKKEGERKRKKQRVIVPYASGYASNKFMRLEKELLPGIDNQVTLENITSRMQWMTLQTLSSVSPAWQQAIRDGLTHEARGRTNSRETFFVVNNIIRPGDANGIALLSLRDNVSCQLPPIPCVGIPWGSQCATLDGKVYIFGGSKNFKGYNRSRDVYVLDLAGRKHWQQCAKMQEGRRDFGSGVKDGKIYVIGGTKSDIRTAPTATGAEVYDPQENAWSAIKPMPSSYWNHPSSLKVATVGEKLYVYYGKGTRSGYCLYDPVMEEWRINVSWRTNVANVGNTASKKAFCVAQGTLHSFHLSERLRESEILEIDGEFLAIVKYEHGIRRLMRPWRRGLGFINTARNTEDYVWEQVSSLNFGSGTFMCPTQL